MVVAPTPKPKVSLIAVGVLALLIAAACMAVRLMWIEPLPAPVQPRGWAALPFAVLFGLGVAVVLGLAWANRRRWRVVLHPNRGRVIGAVALTFVTPLMVFSWMPWILGGLLLAGLGYLTNNGLPQFSFADALSFLASILVPTLFWYPISCLIVSGIKSRWVRVAVYSLMFWAAYSAIILMTGTQRFML